MKILKKLGGIKGNKKGEGFNKFEIYYPSVF